MKDLTVKEMARMGGLAVKEKYGRDHFVRMGKKGKKGKKRLSTDGLANY